MSRSVKVTPKSLTEGAVGKNVMLEAEEYGVTLSGVVTSVNWPEDGRWVEVGLEGAGSRALNVKEMGWKVHFTD